MAQDTLQLEIFLKGPECGPLPRCCPAPSSAPLPPPDPPPHPLPISISPSTSLSGSAPSLSVPVTTFWRLLCPTGASCPSTSSSVSPHPIPPTEVSPMLWSLPPMDDPPRTPMLQSGPSERSRSPADVDGAAAMAPNESALLFLRRLLLQRLRKAQPSSGALSELVRPLGRSEPVGEDPPPDDVPPPPPPLPPQPVVLLRLCPTLLRRWPLPSSPRVRLLFCSWRMYLCGVICFGTMQVETQVHVSYRQVPNQ